MLLVDDPDAGLVRAADDGADVFRGFAAGTELFVYDLGGFDGGLGVEFGCGGVSALVVGTLIAEIYLDTRL